jgi:glycerol-3-phosphate dehydrogenase
MDDHHLGLWAAEQARKAGAMLLEHQNVLQVTLEGQILQAKGAEQYDIVINVAGPWAEELLQQSQINSPYQLDLVRGSHILLSGEPPPVGFCLETGEDKRIFFVLPYQGHILVGTTEVRQAVDQMPWCTPAEVEYLLRAYNRHFQDTRTDSDIIGRYAGIRPLLRSAQDPSSLSREYVIWRDQRLLCVFGGKWTTARALARKVANMLEMDTAG